MENNSSESLCRYWNQRWYGSKG